MSAHRLVDIQSRCLQCLCVLVVPYTRSSVVEYCYLIRVLLWRPKWDTHVGQVNHPSGVPLTTVQRKGSLNKLHWGTPCSRYRAGLQLPVTGTLAYFLTSGIASVFLRHGWQGWKFPIENMPKSVLQGETAQLMTTFCVASGLPEAVQPTDAQNGSC